MEHQVEGELPVNSSEQIREGKPARGSSFGYQDYFDGIPRIGSGFQLSSGNDPLTSSDPLSGLDSNKTSTSKGGWNFRIPRFISMDHDFYKLIFLNLEGEGFKISSIQVLLGFQRYLLLVDRRFTKKVARSLIELQNEEKLIEWERFFEYMHSCEAKARFRGSSRSRAKDDGDFAFEKVTTIALTPLERAFITFEDGTSSLWAALYSSLRLLVIVVSVLFIVLESCPGLRESSPSSSGESGEPTAPGYFRSIEIATVSAFTFDYLVRISLAGFVRHELTNRPLLIEMSVGRRKLIQSKSILDRLIRYATDILCLIDLASIVPFYVELAMDSGNRGLQVFRVIRLLSVLRLISRKDVRDIQLIISRTFSAAKITLIWLFVFFMVMILFFAVIMFYAECGYWYPAGSIIAGVPITQGQYYRLDLFGKLEPTPFYSVPASAYWAVITATTVGYGDVSPTTEWGRLVACFISIMGIVVLAMPIAVIGSMFSREHDRFFAIQKCMRLSQEQQLQKRLMNKLMADWNLHSDNNEIQAANKNETENGIPSLYLDKLRSELAGGEITSSDAPRIFTLLNSLVANGAENVNLKDLNRFLLTSFDLLDEARDTMSDAKLSAIRELLIDISLHISRCVKH